MIIKEFVKRDNPFDYIVLGFIMKIIGAVGGFFISYIISNSIFGIISWILIIKGFSLIPGKLHFPFNNTYKLLLYFFLFQCAIMIIRGYMIDYPYIWISTIGLINCHLFDPTYILCYMMPFAALIPVRYLNFRLILLYSSLFVLITLIMAIIYRNQIVTSSAMSAMGLGEDTLDLVQGKDIVFYGYFSFVPLLCNYIPPKKWYWNMIGLTIVILLVILSARRGATMLSSILFLASLYMYTLSKSKKIRWIVSVVVFILIVIVVYIIINSSIVTFLVERGMQDNRSGVENGMLNQMSSMEMLFGKGLNGRYYYPFIYADADDYMNGWRYGVETGFLNLVLKGGYLLALTYVLLLAIPAFKGFFYSKNYLCKAGAFYISHSLFALWPYGLLTFNLSFFFIWMMILCCMNKGIRNMTDEEIKQKFFYNIS